VTTPVRRIVGSYPLIVLARVGQLNLLRAGVPETLVPNRNAVEAALKHRPQPEGCSLHVNQADTPVEKPETAWIEPRPRSSRPSRTRSYRRNDHDRSGKTTAHPVHPVA
jgi:hypothetical protein